MVDTALRPRTLSDMVGQRSVLEKLDIAMAAAKKRAEKLGAAKTTRKATGR